MYSHMHGGVGIGAGEGNEGVECGRGSACLGARIVEHETCEQDLLDTIEKSQTPESPERWRGSCYLTQEIEGIGELRSWCSWCERVVLGKNDKAEIAGDRLTSSSSSSSLSSQPKLSYRY
jgi:hypothetical protein